MNNQIEGLCYVCKQPLIWNKDDPNCFLDDALIDEEGVLKGMKCEHCGTLYHNYIYSPGTYNCDISCDDQGFGKCINCGGVLGWSEDYMRSSLRSSDDESTLDINDDAIVRNLVCSQCGCDIEVFEPTPNEMKNYPYWKE